MATIGWRSARAQIAELLTSWIPNEQVMVHEVTEWLILEDEDKKNVSDGFLIDICNHKFYVVWKSSSSAAAISIALHWLARENDDRIPIMAVPYMGQTGRELCKKENVNWMDISGNAYIQAPGLLIDKSGYSNKFIRRGRPSSVFAPKSSRVIRWLLLNPEKSFTNKRVVDETGADEGHISRILKHLTEEGYISRKEKGEHRLLNPELLLADWQSNYDFFKQCDVIRGHIPARTSEELVQTLSNNLKFGAWPPSRLLGQGAILSSHVSQLNREGLPNFAFTGLTAAWQYTQFVNYRLVTVYIEHPPSDLLLSHIQFREEPRGANVWLAIPKDDGVFMGTEKVNGIPCVSRVQTYIDLKDQPERSDEAAEELKRMLGIGAKNG